MRNRGSWFITAVAVALCLGAGSSHAQGPRTTDVLRGCRDVMNTIPKEPKLAATCFDVVRTVLELGRDLKTSPSCPPAGTDSGAAVSVVLRYADAKPDRTGEPFGRFVAEALAQAWPCR